MNKPLITPQVIFTNYPMLEGDSPLAKRFNEVQGAFWVATDSYIPPNDLLLSILIEDYNERKLSQSEPT